MKIGVIGYGSIGKRHAANATALGHEVKVYDPIERRDYEFERVIYDDCDAIVVATPSPFHEGPLRAAIEYGKHVLIEKPISTSIGMLPELLAIADKKKRVVMMGNNLRFHPCVQQAKAWIDAGEIGTPIWAHFICATKSVKPVYLSDGVILNTGSHEVDMALHLLGPAYVIYANATNKLRAGTADSDINVYFTDDVSDFLLAHENGCRSSFHLDFVTPNEIREASIVGHRDNLRIDLPNRWASSLGGLFKKADGTYDDDYVAEMRAFIDRIEGKDVPGATGQDGLATLDILLDIRSKAGVAPR